MVGADICRAYWAVDMALDLVDKAARCLGCGLTDEMRSLLSCADDDLSSVRRLLDEVLEDNDG